MYEVIVPASVYSEWQCYKECGKQQTFSNAVYFSDWVLARYPEVLDTANDGSIYINGDMTRRFVFESEEHYHWFLLRQ